MTLIVALVAGNWAFHASDRFVSVKPTPANPTGEYDPHSNKTVVVVGTDSWVVLGYTGLAFLDGKPTDRLLAEAISGYDELAPAMMTFWQRPPDLHYREIRRRVEEKLKAAYSRLPLPQKKPKVCRRPLATSQTSNFRSSPRTLYTMSVDLTLRDFERVRDEHCESRCRWVAMST